MYSEQVVPQRRKLMDAEKWSRYYERTKKSDGFKEAATGLLGGMLREMKSRAERIRPHGDPAGVVRGVDELFREVASDYSELSKDGFSEYLKLESPHLYSMLEEG